MLRRSLIPAIGVLPPVSAQPALAADSAEGWLYRDAGPQLGSFSSIPDDELVIVSDDHPDHWSVMVELWWGGKLRRTCWETRGADRFHFNRCDFEVQEGTDITFYIAEARRGEWRRCAPAKGCGKRPNFWAGQDAWGCSVVPDPALPCAEPEASSDLHGEA